MVELIHRRRRCGKTFAQVFGFEHFHLFAKPKQPPGKLRGIEHGGGDLHPFRIKGRDFLVRGQRGFVEVFGGVVGKNGFEADFFATAEI